MENYIIIAHPIEFVCGALKAFAKYRGRLTYRLDPVDDVAFRVQDLCPSALILHQSYKHNHMSQAELLREFQCPVYFIGDNPLEGTNFVQEPIEPSELIKNIVEDLESSVS